MSGALNEAGDNRSDMILAYETWVTPHLGDLRNYCLYLTRSKWDAEDLYQDTLLKSLAFFLHAEHYLDIKPFFFRIAKNLWIDECRKRKRRQGVLVDQPNDCYTDNNYAEVRGMIDWLAERFPSRSIEMWLLSTYFGYTMQEIARAMNCSISAVKSVLFRTREAIRSRHAVHEHRKVIHLDRERWSRAIMQDRPQSILSEE